MVIEESGLKFQFSENARALKYDDTKFYRNFVNHMPRAKGVDFLSVYDGSLVFTEVKNCKGQEAENNWRIQPDNRKRDTSHTSTDVTGRESLDIEVAEKTAMTIAGLIGAYSKASFTETAEILADYAKAMVSDKMRNGKSRLLVILFLEGDFGCETRRKPAIMRALEDSIRKKLHWLNCNVSVVDSDTYQKKVFELIS